MVGTGGPRQTVIGTGHIDGPLRVLPSEQKVPGVSQQTVYTPSGGVTVLVGTGIDFNYFPVIGTKSTNFFDKQVGLLRLFIILHSHTLTSHQEATHPTVMI